MPRCLLVSNRLPVAYNSKGNVFSPSSGGLVSAIKGLDSAKVGFDFEWMGILTDDIDEEKEEESKAILDESNPDYVMIKTKYGFICSTFNAFPS